MIVRYTNHSVTVEWDEDAFFALSCACGWRSEPHWYAKDCQAEWLAHFNDRFFDPPRRLAA